MPHTTCLDSQVGYHPWNWAEPEKHTQDEFSDHWGHRSKREEGDHLRIQKNEEQLSERENSGKFQGQARKERQKLATQWRVVQNLDLAAKGREPQSLISRTPPPHTLPVAEVCCQVHVYCLFSLLQHTAHACKHALVP